MTVTPRLGLQQKHRLALSPNMRQALSILRMPTDQLCDEINRAASENPYLVVRQRSSASAYDVALATIAEHESMLVSLVRQIEMQRLDPVVRSAALVLVGQLRDDGFLDTPMDEIAFEYQMPPEVMIQGLEVLQRCEPTGVGARNLTECLVLQLIEKAYTPDLAQKITQHLDDFAENRISRLVSRLSLPAAQIERIMRDMRSLTATPIVEKFAPVIPRIPELIVQRRNDRQLDVLLNSDALPHVSMVKLGHQNSDSPEMQRCFDNAHMTLRNLAARGATLLRIGRYIVDSQSAFFQGSLTAIRPDSRAQAAEHLGLHPSTLGRALAGKALLFDGKVYSLSQFFSQAIPTLSGTISAFEIQCRMRALILAEDRRLPLADEDICTHFKKEGVDIARRTIAKYRKCMRIPTSYERRRRALSEPPDTRGRTK